MVNEVWTFQCVMQAGGFPLYLPYHAVLAVKGCACGARWRPSTV
jgi:hypothetical protein